MDVALKTHIKVKYTITIILYVVLIFWCSIINSHTSTCKYMYIGYILSSHTSILWKNILKTVKTKVTYFKQITKLIIPRLAWLIFYYLCLQKNLFKIKSAIWHLVIYCVIKTISQNYVVRMKEIIIIKINQTLK